MKILITGGSGFIGTNVVEHFATSHEVLNLDLVHPQNKDHEALWHQVDITDREALEREVTAFAPEYIVHLAARTDLHGSTIDDYAANVAGVANLMDACRKLTSLKKVVVASSMLVCRVGYLPAHQRDYAPSTAYGESKVETENIVWAAGLTCDWALIRPTSIWGPWFGVPYRNFFDMVKRKMYFHIGHRACTKTYGYVGNAVYQIERLLFSDTRDEGDKTFYIGDRPPINIEEWANEIAAELQIHVPRVPYWIVRMAAWGGDMLKWMHIKFPMTSFRLKNMTTDNVMNLDNTCRVAPNPPFTRLEGVKKTLEWIQYNEHNNR